jgi:multiple antibiotic resistance protein
MAAIANIILAAIAFSFAARIERLLGRNGIRTLSKIASLLIASIAVMMIRRGVFEMIASLSGQLPPPTP